MPARGAESGGAVSWAKFDDAFWSHPKVVRAGNEAVGAFVRMVCYCSQYLTDGAVPAATAREITRPKILERLVEVGLLEADGDGFRVHGYLERNPSRLQVEAERAAKTQRQNRWRETRAQEPKTAPNAGKAPRVDASTAPSQDASKDAAPSRPVPTRRENTACSLRTREEPSPEQPATGAWWLDPWAVVNRLRERSQGKLQLTLNGHERELSRTLAALTAQRPRFADELDHWATLVARDEASWWRGAWTIGALLGRADETGRRAADGLLRCLDEAAARMPSKRPALRAVRPSAPVDVITPERAQELAAQFRAARAERERERAAAEREVANG